MGGSRKKVAAGERLSVRGRYPGPVKALRVPTEAAERARLEMVRRGLFDADRRVAPPEVAGDGHVEVPVVADPPDRVVEAFGGRVVEGAPARRTWFRDPRVAVRRALQGRVPDAVLAALPDGYVRLGDVLLLDLPAAVRPHAEAVAAAFADALGVRSVLDVKAVRGELRRPDARLLWGDADTTTVHREHGLAYRLDPARVMFSPGNKAERRRIAEMDLAGRTVVDLFAGVGQFALPAASAGARVVACEKNPTAAAFLADNAEENGLADRIEVRAGDCREVAPAAVADLVLMGLLPNARPFLDVARRALSPDGPGDVLLHDVVGAGRSAPVPDGFARVEERIVKSYGPSREHVVLHLRRTEGPAASGGGAAGTSRLGEAAP